MHEPSLPVFARFRGHDLTGVGARRGIVFPDRDVYRAFLAVWSKDLHVEEVSAVHSVFDRVDDTAIFWDTIHG